jgi:bacteriocin-like protein
MSNPSEQDTQQALTPMEFRQYLLATIEAEKQALQELSDKDLAAVTGGGFFSKLRGNGTQPNNTTQPNNVTRPNIENDPAYEHGSILGQMHGGDAEAQKQAGLFSYYMGGHSDNMKNNKAIWDHAKKVARIFPR